MDTTLVATLSNISLGGTSRRVSRIRDLANLSLRFSILVYIVAF